MGLKDKGHLSYSICNLDHSNFNDACARASKDQTNSKEPNHAESSPGSTQKCHPRETATEIITCSDEETDEWRQETIIDGSKWRKETSIDGSKWRKESSIQGSKWKKETGIQGSRWKNGTNTHGNREVVRKQHHQATTNGIYNNRKDNSNENMNRLAAGNQVGKPALLSRYLLNRNLEDELVAMVDAGSVRALSALGRFYFFERKFFKSLATLKRCPHWDLDAHYRLGIIYFDGLETKRDLKRGVKHMTKVATASVKESGVPEALIRSAQYFVGYAYYAGFGVITNEDEAIRWWLLAANEGKSSGSMLAQTALGLYYSDPWHFDVDRSVHWHMLADTNGNQNSKAPHAVMYVYGLGTEKNPIKALHMLKEAAFNRNVYAAGHLVAFYYHRKMFNLAAQVAERVTCDRLFNMEESAIKNKADCKGLALAAFYLGRCYQLGRGVEQHLPTANHLYKKAIKLDYEAMYKLYQDMIEDIA